ncbi:MAG: U32 family peptidase [Spirochaetes bacterium]|nr:U32 family peptidase [Spirochaetota bacterium]
MNNPELLAPAGSLEALDAAVGEGADAVYLGLRSFNARMRTRNFAFNQFEAAVDTLHKSGKRIYVTVNTVFEDRESDRMYQLLQYIDRVGPDGVIVQDLGTVRLAREEFPKLRLHASTQMNVASAAGANFLSRFGFKRVVLARESTLDEIASIRRATNIEIETFVHGALCVSCSGICLFSSYLGGKSANRGVCAQACRRLYEADGARSGYFFSPDDLQLIGKVPELVEAGVSSFKIEGRMKSAEYVGAVTAAYRYLIDNWRHDRERAEAKAKAILQSDFARRKTTYWFDGRVEPDYIKIDQAGGTGTSLGKVRKVRAFEEDGPRWALVTTHEGLAEGDSVRIHSADDSGRVTSKIRGIKMTPEGMYLKLECEFKAMDQIYLIQTASAGKRFRRVIPDDLARFRAFPSWDAAPGVPFAKARAEVRSDWPDGLYAMVSRFANLHTLLSVRPTKAVLRLTRKTAGQLRKYEKELPFKRDSLVLWLEPWLAESDAEWLAAELDWWCERGQRHFIANNLGHFTMLRGRDAAIVAGPFLYAFNPYAAAFLFEAGSECIVPPLEVSKQDIFRLAEIFDKRSWMLPVFAFPQLFTIRADLGASHDFRFFSDRDRLSYELVSGQEGSVVIPANPFSIVDRVPFLRKEGFGKFLLDFSFVDLKKPLYRQVMAAAEEAKVLPETHRFNWKEGFWTPEEERKPVDREDDRAEPVVDPESRPAGGRSDRTKARGGRIMGKDGLRPRGTDRHGVAAPGSRRGRGIPGAGRSSTATGNSAGRGGKTSGRKPGSPGRGRP